MARQALQDAQRLLMCAHLVVTPQVGHLSMSTPCGALTASDTSSPRPPNSNTPNRRWSEGDQSQRSGHQD
jgi:hypothetical protein